MTISDTLAALSELRDFAYKLPIGEWPGKTWSERAGNSTRMCQALDAILSDQLVLLPSVETLARAMAEQANDYDGDVLQWECWADSATAVIAAMQETKP